MFHGSMVALVTPMQADGALDREAMDRLVEFHIENGTLYFATEPVSPHE